MTETTRAAATDDVPTEATSGAVPAADAAGASGPRRRPALKLPLKLPLKFPLKLPLKLSLKVPALPAAKLPGKSGGLAAPRPRPQAWALPRPGRLPWGDLALALGAASLALSLLWVVTGPVRARARDRDLAARTVANAATLQLAAETYAAANQGRYPRDARALVPWLPGARAPRNPYTGDGCLFRAAPGEVTWRRLPGTGYVIEAWGTGPGGVRRLASFHSGSAAPQP